MIVYHSCSGFPLRGQGRSATQSRKAIIQFLLMGKHLAERHTLARPYEL